MGISHELMIIVVWLRVIYIFHKPCFLLHSSYVFACRVCNMSTTGTTSGA